MDINGAPLSIWLTAAAKGLDEVVVVGYGTQKKKDLTGRRIHHQRKRYRRPANHPGIRSITGQYCRRVSVTRSSGAPGAGSSILIRGITTLGTNSPLIILDGVPRQQY